MLLGIKKQGIATLAVFILTALLCSAGFAAQVSAPAEANFPLPLSKYPSSEGMGLVEVLKQRIAAHPFNPFGTLIFILAITHTFMAPFFMRLAHRFEDQHQAELIRKGRAPDPGHQGEVSFKAEVFHFLGEVEAIFGIWIIPLVIAISLSSGWHTARDYIGSGLNFTEPMFVVVIMTIAASRPVLKASEKMLAAVASIGGGSIPAWWLSILTIGPLLGSFITEPAAMTISALLLANRFYRFAPRPVFAYATLGLLFVNISVGGTLTHFAAPPVLMVASRWGWDLKHMFFNFGLEALIGIVISNAVYFTYFRKEFQSLKAAEALIAAQAEKKAAEEPVPMWITAVHIFFLGWTVLNNHHPVLFVGGFLFYLAFTRATEHHQSELALRPALLVGFFLAGLVVHGGLQGWWIEPVLSNLSEVPLFLGAMGLTAFNDNAAITYLATLVPNFTPEMKHAVVAGAVVGGGLTVIANAPNPAGQSILSKFFPDGVSPLKLFLGAAFPTAVLAVVFLLLR